MEKELELKSKTGFVTAVIFLFALLIRLIGLGSSSLTMNEAENAMAALRLFQNGSNSQLLYTLPTALMFKFFGSSEFSARLLPALMGSFLVLLPLLLKNRIGSSKSLLLSFLFAVDPVLLFWSKRADAVIPALMLFAAALVFLQNGWNTAAVVCFLIALCGGERVWPVVLLTCVWAVLVHFLPGNCSFSIMQRNFRRKDILIGLLVFGLFCGCFGIFPGGFAGFGRGFTAAFQHGPQWLYPGPAAELIALALYCGIPLVFFVVSCFRNRSFFKLGFAAVALAVLILWQGIVMLPWIVSFLWVESADEILRLLGRLSGPKDFAFYLAACLVPCAYAFFYFRLVELFRNTNGNELIQIQINGTMQSLPLTRFQGTVLLMAASVLIIALIVKILLGFLESDSIRRGMLCGSVIALSWVLITGMWNSAGIDRVGDHPAAPHPENTANILNGAYTSYTNTALFEFLDETIAKHGDSKNTQFGLNLIVNDPMLDWYFRQYPGIKTTVNSNTDLTGIDLILDRTDTPRNGQGYAGARLSWRGIMDWKRMSLQDWGQWLIFGDGKLTEEAPLTLWVRGDYIYSF